MRSYLGLWISLARVFFNWKRLILMLVSLLVIFMGLNFLGEKIYSLKDNGTAATTLTFPAKLNSGINYYSEHPYQTKLLSKKEPEGRYRFIDESISGFLDSKFLAEESISKAYVFLGKKEPDDLKKVDSIRYYVDPLLPEMFKTQVRKSFSSDEFGAQEVLSEKEANVVYSKTPNGTQMKSSGFSAVENNIIASNLLITIMNHNHQLIFNSPERAFFPGNEFTVQRTLIKDMSSKNIDVLVYLSVALIFIVMFANVFFSFISIALDAEKHKGSLIPFALFKYSLLHLALIRFLVVAAPCFIVLVVGFITISQIIGIMSFSNAVLYFVSLGLTLFMFSLVNALWSLLLTFMFRHILGRFFARMLFTPIALMVMGAWRIVMPFCFISLMILLKGKDLDVFQSVFIGIAVFNLFFVVFLGMFSAILCWLINWRIGKSKIGYYPS